MNVNYHLNDEITDQIDVIWLEVRRHLGVRKISRKTIVELALLDFFKTYKSQRLETTAKRLKEQDSK